MKFIYAIQISHMIHIMKYCKAVRTCFGPGICRRHDVLPDLVSCSLSPFCRFPGWGMSEQLCNTKALATFSHWKENALPVEGDHVGQGCQGSVVVAKVQQVLAGDARISQHVVPDHLLGGAR